MRVGSSPNQFAVVGDDAYVGSGEQKADPAVFVLNTDRDVSKPAEIADGDLAEGVDLVSANTMAGGSWLLSGLGLDE